MQARPGFARAIEELLSEKYPHFLPRFPESVRLKIVRNMLDRASLWSISKQRPFLAYCEFMIVIAANFDEEAEIRTVLERERANIDQVMAELPSFVSDASWERAERSASSLPFYVSPDRLGASLPEQTLDALPLVAGDVLDGAKARSAIQWATNAASEYGLQGLPDAVLVLSVCFAMYGPHPAWLRETVAEGWNGRALLEAMRLRLALDFGRYV